MSFSFNQLNLANSSVSTGGSLLPVGRHVVKITDAKVIDTADRTGKRLEINLAAVDGSGTIRHYINVHLPKSSEGTRIGRDELKTMLYYGGHANPDSPGDVNTMKGLVFGVVVAADSYKKDGVERETVRVKSVIDPFKIDPTNFSEKKPPAAKPAQGAANFGGTAKADGMDDEIPF